MNDNIESSNIPGYVSVKEAAKVLGLSPRTVYDYVEEGRLQSTRFADVIAISVEELKNFGENPLAVHVKTLLSGVFPLETMSNS